MLSEKKAVRWGTVEHTALYAGKRKDTPRPSSWDEDLGEGLKVRLCVG